MGKYADGLIPGSTESIDISEPTASDRAASANTTEPATHVNRSAEKRAYTVQQQRALDRMEGKIEGGALSLTPKERLLDAEEAKKLNPDSHVRWLSLRNTEKLDSRKEEGYVKLAEEDGGRQLGDSMALFAIPRQLRDARVKRQEESTRARMGSVKELYGEVGARLAHELKRSHGLSDSEVRRLIINE